jgi:hypothetical protein
MTTSEKGFGLEKLVEKETRDIAIEMVVQGFTVHGPVTASGDGPFLMPRARGITSRSQLMSSSHLRALPFPDQHVSDHLLVSAQASVAGPQEHTVRVVTPLTGHGKGLSEIRCN